MAEDNDTNKTAHDLPVEEQDPYQDVGRRLYAAIVSANLRLRSIDYALRVHTPARLHRSWGELGWKLQRGLTESVTRQLRGEDRKDEPRQNKIHLVQ